LLLLTDSERKLNEAGKAREMAAIVRRIINTSRAPAAIGPYRCSAEPRVLIPSI